MGVSPQAVYRWKRRYGGLGLHEVRELRQLREENRKLKGIVRTLHWTSASMFISLRCTRCELAEGLMIIDACVRTVAALVL